MFCYCYEKEKEEIVIKTNHFLFLREYSLTMNVCDVLRERVSVGEKLLSVENYCTMETAGGRRMGG
jgi:hypothetical protein